MYRDTIEKVINYRDRCVFCQSKLKVILTNHFDLKRNVPTLNSKYDSKNKRFDFTLEYVSSSIDLKAEGWIDAINNFLVLDKDIESDYFKRGSGKYSEVFEAAVKFFNNSAPHVESYCPSRKCGLKYYFSSNIFRVWNIAQLSDNKCLIPGVCLHSECFNVDNFWVQNDLVLSKTNIYLTKNPDSEPIKTDLIDFGTLDKEKLLNKIKMLVTFS